MATFLFSSESLYPRSVSLNTTACAQGEWSPAYTKTSVPALGFSIFVMLPFTAVLDDKMLVSWARQLTFALYRFTNCTPPPSPLPLGQSVFKYSMCYVLCTLCTLYSVCYKICRGWSRMFGDKVSWANKYSWVGAKGRERRGNKVGGLIGPVADIDFLAGGIVLLKLISICHSLAVIEKIRNFNLISPAFDI